MRIIASAAAMQKLARRWKRAGTRAGFVPTMGCLHAGHLSLVKRARRAVGKKGVVVVSVFVNPTQFGPKEDFSRYPRDLKHDLMLCREAGVDLVFTPGDKEMYPDRLESGFSAYVVEGKLSQSMEGASRPTHFRGVTTVVAKLFNLILPEVAVFGAKDWQQAAIVKHMTADLNFPVRIIVAPTLRERDGLAMSSRNRYLAGDLRRQATVLWRAIQAARAAIKKLPAPEHILKARLKRLIEAEPDAKVDYIEFFNPETLVPVSTVRFRTHMALAVFIGKTRLIDNANM